MENTSIKMIKTIYSKKLCKDSYDVLGRVKENIDDSYKDKTDKSHNAAAWQIKRDIIQCKAFIFFCEIFYFNSVHKITPVHI